MLGSAAKIRALITERPKRGNQSQEAHELLSARAKALASLVDGLDLRTIHSPDVRHSLEHFDERIDQTAESLVHGDTRLPAFIPFDMAISDRQTLNALKTDQIPDPEFVLLRVYVADQRRFINAGHEIDIGGLHQEASGVARRLAPLLPHREVGRGSSIVVVTDQSFD